MCVDFCLVATSTLSYFLIAQKLHAVVVFEYI